MAKMPFEDAGAGLVKNWEPVDVSAGDQTMPRVGVALRVTGAGDVAFTEVDGSTKTMPFTDFDRLPGSFVSIQKVGTTATGVFVGLP